MIEVLLLGRECGPKLLRTSLEQALQCGCTDVHAVRLLIQSARMVPRPAIEVFEIGALRSYDRPAPSLQDYDQLRTGIAVAGVRL
jgi:hypothetical protein